MQPREIEKPKIEYETREYTDEVIKFKKLTREVPRIKFEDREDVIQKVDMVDKEYTVKRIRNKPDIFKQLMDVDEFGCECYDKECDCLGEPDCECCFPKCECAPKNPKVIEQVEIIQ